MDTMSHLNSALEAARRELLDLREQVRKAERALKSAKSRSKPTERRRQSLGDAMTMTQSQQYIANAENCAELAAQASDEPTRNRYKRMEAAWRALAVEQDWLDGVIDPNGKSSS